MKYANVYKRSRLFLLVFSSLVLIFLGGASLAADETIVMATGEYPPYVSADMEGYGFSSRVVSAVAEEIGWEVEYRFYPWDRCEYMVKEGRVFGALPYSQSEERKAFSWFSGEISPSRMVFFKYLNNVPDSFSWDELSDFRPYKVGVVRGYYYLPAFEEAGLDLDVSPDIDSGIKKLKGGRIDILPGNELVVRHKLRQIFPDSANQFSVLDKPYSDQNMYLMVSKEYPKSRELLREFNRGLDAIKADGTYADLKAEYGIQ